MSTNTLNADLARVLAIGEAARAFKELYDTEKATIVEQLEEGERRIAKVNGVKLGSASKGDARRRAEVTDIHALLAEALHRQMELKYRITDLPAAIAVLQTHAPELIEPTLSEQDFAYLLKSAEGGETIPGITVRETPATARLTVSKEAKAAMREEVQRWINAGAFTALDAPGEKAINQ